MAWVALGLRSSPQTPHHLRPDHLKSASDEPEPVHLQRAPPTFYSPAPSDVLESGHPLRGPPTFSSPVPSDGLGLPLRAHPLKDQSHPQARMNQILYKPSYLGLRSSPLKEGKMRKLTSHHLRPSAWPDHLRSAFDGLEPVHLQRAPPTFSSPAPSGVLESGHPLRGPPIFSSPAPSDGLGFLVRTRPLKDQSHSLAQILYQPSSLGM